MSTDGWVRSFRTLSSADASLVGGKNSALGELMQRFRGEGVRVPEGFATLAAAYRDFVAFNALAEPIRKELGGLEARPLAEVGQSIRRLILGGNFPEAVEQAIREAYRTLSAELGEENADVAVRSSATLEDLPEASFAGLQESFLHVCGADAVLEACRRCFASLFTDRAIAYRERHGFGHLDVAISVGVQQMVRADQGGAGVLFTLDVDTGFPRIVLVNAGWGLGESVVQGTIEPDQYRLFKPFLSRGLPAVIEKVCGKKQTKQLYGDDGATRAVETSRAERETLVLTDDELVRLGRWGVAIERHFGRPVDVEWAKDGQGQIYILQARPETVHARRARGALLTHRLKQEGTLLLSGLAIGQAIASGRVRVLKNLEDMERFQAGEILVTSATNPDWVPVLKKASAVIAEHGGRTSHAAIVSRELGVPAVVGAARATELLSDGQEVTVSCAGRGDEGRVYAGRLGFETEEVRLDALPATRTRVMMNIASPSAALAWWRLPVRGIGLARMEYLVGNLIRVHPMALARFDKVLDAETREGIEALTLRYTDKCEYFVDQLAQGVALMAAARYPDPVVVRLSDFKTNEYAKLLGGAFFEPHEENPMLGWRGASRYYDPDYRDGFALECRALKRVRESMGFVNVVVMVPFCRTPKEADRVLEVMAEHGLRRGEASLKVWVMAEIPSNILEAEGFAERFDGFSIGSNDLTQLVHGVSRDSEKLSTLFDERSPSVRWMIRELVWRAHRAGRSVSLCGQAPSDHPEFAAFLVEVGLDSISVNPDSVARVLEHVARAEQVAPEPLVVPS